jgi:hypothetical protein
MQRSRVGYGSNSSEAGFVNEPDSNLSGGSNKLSMQKPDSVYIQQINKPLCSKSDIVFQDNTNNTYEEDNMYCYNNGTNGEAKKLVQWKKVDGLWIGRHLTNSSEYKEINNQVCKVITPGCDSMNPSQGCAVKCFADDKSTSVFTADYVVLPN